jgi:hypothetical protein
MTTAGWIFMGASWAVLLVAFIYTLVRTLRPKS